LKNRIIRRICIVVLALVASSAACFQLGSSWLQPATAQTGDGRISGSVSPLVWGLADTQTLRICASGASATSGFPMITSIAGSSGFVFLERELAVPRDGFSCVDISHAMLVAAGLPRNPTTEDITFQLTFGGPSRANGTTAVIAVMNIDAATGHIDLYSHIDLYRNIWVN